MHLVHNSLRTLRPFTYTETFCRLGWKVRRVAFFDQGRLRPKVDFFPQFSQIAIACLPFLNDNCTQPREVPAAGILCFTRTAAFGMPPGNGPCNPMALLDWHPKT